MNTGKQDKNICRLESRGEINTRDKLAQTQEKTRPTPLSLQVNVANKKANSRPLKQPL